MPTMFRNSWSLGWTPNSAEIGGDIRGLIRADNLTWNEDGSLSKIPGTLKISSGAFATFVSQIFSKTLAAISLRPKFRYVVSGGNVLRNYGGANSETVFDKGIISGATGIDWAGFGFGAGHIFITYGTQKIKDNGVIQSAIGMNSPLAPSAIVNPPPILLCSPDPTTPTIPNFTFWEALVNGSSFVAAMDYCQIDSDPEMLNAIAIQGLSNFFSLNANNIGGIPNTGTPEDTYSMSVRLGDSSTFVKVILAFMLQDPTASSAVSDATDYYQFEWGDLNAFNQGINAWSTIQCKKKDFVRVGTDDALGWSNIRGIKVTFVSTEAQTFVFNNMKFTGGKKGALTGIYQYYQINVQNTGYYLEKSKPSPISAEYAVKDASTTVTPSALHPQAIEAWIYRVGGQLAQPMLIAKRVAGFIGGSLGPFTDEVSDEAALIQGEVLNQFEENLPDNIIGMECNWKGRNWYITYDTIYPSPRDNFSNYDIRLVINNAGRNVEYNQFITRRDNDTLILSTNVDFYEITGSAGIISENEVDFFDVTVRPLGIKSPSISRTFSVHEGNLFYLAADGIRVLSGSNCMLLSESIDLLFRNEVRHGVSPIRISTNLTEQYYIGVSKNRVFFSTVTTDNKRALLVLDIATKLWRYEDHGDTDSISALFVEEDGAVIYSTASFGDKFLRQLEVGALMDGTTNSSFVYRTVFDDNDQPRNRKDSFNLKIIAESTNSPVTIKLKCLSHAGPTSESNLVQEQTFIDSFNGPVEKIFTIDPSIIKLVKLYQLEIIGAVPFFKLMNWSIDYEPRPTQLSQLRIQPTQFGIAGRKRLSEIPFLVDTLGNVLHFIPILDGTSVTESTHSTTNKTLATHYFTTDTTAYNIGFYIYGTLFEFYELIQPREIELIPDPIKYKLIPFNNLGTASVKRIIQYAIVIDTRGQNVEMVPYIDGIPYSAQTINTNYKKTVIYTFDNAAKGVDIACTLKSLTATPFEFYDINLNESVYEKLPPKATAMEINCTNYGVAAPKRIRTIPFVIDTHGSPVIYTPIVDGVSYPPSIHNTNRKATVLHYFEETNGDGIPFGIDYCGDLQGIADFEFYELLKPEIVEVLPVGKKFDQLGPVEFNKVGKIREISIRMVPTGTTLLFRILASDIEILTGTVPTTAWQERTYRISCPKGINPNIFRMELWSTSVFHRIDALVKVNIDGSTTENKWVKIK